MASHIDDKPVHWSDCSTSLGPSTVLSTYDGYLSSASSEFSRLHGAGEDYYYQALRVTTPTSGTYTFTSESWMDTYGYLYQDSFDPAYPSQNLMTYNDDSGGNRQFLLTAYLSYGSTYTLIITTAGRSLVGSFSIRVSGPSLVGLLEFTLSTSISIGIAGECIKQHVSAS